MARFQRLPGRRRDLDGRLARLARLIPSVRSNALELRLTDLEQRVRLDLSAQIAALAHPAFIRGDTADRLGQHELRIHSQNGEDGILLHLLAQTGVGTRHVVEIGIGDGSECNSANLILNWAWSATLVEASISGAERAAAFYRDRDVTVEQAFVTIENAASLLPDQPIDVLSIDIDGNDYWIWEVLDHEPRIAVIEYNASLGPTRSVTIPYDEGFDYREASDHLLYHGASLRALSKLASTKGMSLVGCDSRGVNAFFVRDEFLSQQLPAITPEDAFRPQAKRARWWTQEEQEALLKESTFVEI